MNYEKTTNGIGYTDEIAGSGGANFVLFPTAEHTPEMIREAVREIFDHRDVVSMKVANEQDWDERYRREIFAHPLTRSLKWYEINADDLKVIRIERTKGTTVDDYVNRLVLPFTAETKACNLGKFGDKMFDI